MCRVQLAVSRLAEVPGLGCVYHSSILVDSVEFFFSDAGVVCIPPREGDCPEGEVFSHAAIGNSAEIVEMGTSCRLDQDLLKVLGPRFLPGSYDLLRKNCNSFSDCALTYLLGKRLEARFRQVDSLALGVQSSLPSLLEAASLGQYSHNPAADGFDLGATVRTLETWSRPCPKAAEQRRRKQLEMGPGALQPRRHPVGELPTSPLQLAEGAYRLVDWLADKAADGVLEVVQPLDWLSERAADGVLEVFANREDSPRCEGAAA